MTDLERERLKTAETRLKAAEELLQQRTDELTECRRLMKESGDTIIQITANYSKCAEKLHCIEEERDGLAAELQSETRRANAAEEREKNLKKTLEERQEDTDFQKELAITLQDRLQEARSEAKEYRIKLRDLYVIIGAKTADAWIKKEKDEQED